MRALTLATVVLAATADRISKSATIKSIDGHVVVSSGGEMSNLTDTMSATKVESLFDASATKVKSLFEASDATVVGVQRRAEGNLADLVEDLATSSKENTEVVASIGAALEKNTEATMSIVAALVAIHDAVNASAADDGVQAEIMQTIQENGEGDDKTTTGLPWNPFPAVRLARPLSDLGGDDVRVLFPVGRELVAEKSTKIYQCKFTFIDDDGKVDPDDFRMSVPVAASHERSFACPAPAWGNSGGIPTVLKWKTTFAAFENEREMPAPKGGAVFNWVPATPSIDVGQGPIQRTGPKKGRTFTHPISIFYPYGSDGYKDVQIKATSSNTNELAQINITAANAGAPERVLSFNIKKLDSVKTATYTITFEATSATTGLKSSSVLTIAWIIQPPQLGKGGASGIFSEAAVKFLHNKVGVGNADTWEMCYSSKRDGWSNTQFNSKCKNKGPLFYFQKRGKNNHILGGNVHLNFNSGGYIYGSSSEPKAWLFSIKPNTPDTVSIARKCSRPYMYYPGNSNYLLCYGGGHDQCCDGNSGHCYNNMGHDYCPEGVSGGYGSNAWRIWGGGDYSWNGKDEKDHYEVYRVLA